MADNLSDAIILAGAILIFIVALTVSMSSFTTMTEQIDTIIQHDYKLDLVTDENGNFINYHTSDSDVREVGVETVVSSMYRVPKENYVVYIAGFNVSEITDLKNKGIVFVNLNDEQFYNDDSIAYKDVIKISISGANSNIGKILNSTEGDLYNVLKNKKFKEYLGVYQLKTDDSVEEINKTTYRVITYVIQ